MGTVTNAEAVKIGGNTEADYDMDSAGLFTDFNADAYCIGNTDVHGYGNPDGYTDSYADHSGDQAGNERTNNKVGRMRVRLIQIDGKLPNLALMKLSHWHKQQGHDVVFTRDIYPSLFEDEYHVVYASAIFRFSSHLIDKTRQQWPTAIIGGTAVNLTDTVESIIGDEYEHYDYSIYPEYKDSIGYTHRGCRLNCSFCVVPQKEGKPRSINTIEQIYRGSPHPKNINLLDNDFFGQQLWRDRINEIKSGEYKVCFQQGINIRLVNNEVANALYSIQYRDTKFKKPRLYTAWDNLRDEKIFFRGVSILESAGIPATHLRVYMLIGYDKQETMDLIHYRFNKMVGLGIEPYPMVYDKSNKILKAFQRWVVTGLYRAVPFSEYRYLSGQKRAGSY